MLGVLACLVACAGPIVPADPPHLALYEPVPLPFIEVAGTLTRAGDCLFLDADDGTRYGLAWPAGHTTWESATGRLFVGDQHSSTGDRVSLSGAAVDPAGAGIVLVEPPRAECLGDALFFAQTFTQGS